MTSKAQVVFADSADKIPMEAVDGKITTVYWNICGLGQTPRYVLEMAGVEYADVRLHWGPGLPGTDEYKQMWMAKKRKIGEQVLFPNLPYLIDGDVKISQTNTILKYLGRKFDLMGEAANAHLVDFVLDQTTDFDGAVTGRCYGDFASLKPFCEVQLPVALADWTRLLGDKPFMTGDAVTVADLKIYETLRKLKIIESQEAIGTNTLASFPKVLAFIDRVEALPAMKNYLSSAAFMERPLNNEHAQFK
mmetsp:Transcript_61066/g.108691  ORF Transcript_61066/g.108691 Transcript_61066/m.108691 type:complete len:248 (-) Transcript_61066:38-781(-)